jgi:hypothetical protein
MDTLTTLRIDTTHPHLVTAGLCDEVVVTGFVVSEDEVESLLVVGQIIDTAGEVVAIDLTDVFQDLAELALIEQAIRDEREEPSFRGDLVEPS